MKIAIITGGSRGLGKSMSLRLAEKGHDIILTYNSKKAEADAVVAQIEKMSRKAMALQLDAADHIIQGVRGKCEKCAQGHLATK